MSIVLILSWYVCGACAAQWMVRRGHSATPWCVGGALLGGLLWAVALPCARKAGREVRWTAHEPSIRPDGRVVVGLLDEDGDVADTVQGASRPDDHLVIVHRMGIEATSAVVETGECAEARRRTRELERRWRGSSETRIGAGTPAAVLEGAIDGRQVGLVVRGPVSGWAWRTGLRRSIALGAGLGCPVLHAPAGAGDRIPVTTMAPAARVGRQA